ncbi:MAG: indole-3-glycerol phosphate synthase TrpC [Oscillospiraceae bacterium]|nr:indole-3-glycerol phosphate synthase TrpC [Oscillospiraceae bacterium]
MILQEIAEKTRLRVAEEKAALPLSEMKKRAQELNPDTGFPFKKALSTADISFICEVKRASPSKGMIAEDFPYLDIARDYEAAGAAAISCLTEPFWFKGSDRYLQEIAAAVNIPVLRKDFTVDEYMIYQAKTLGASAVLLICSILSKEQLAEYLEIAHSLGLSALVEAHDEDEVKTAVSVGVGIIGVNNRDLKTFTVDINNSARLRKLVPPEILFVSESGIKTAQDIAALRQNGTNAVLIGETLMRSPDKKAALAQLRGTGA